MLLEKISIFQRNVMSFLEDHCRSKLAFESIFGEFEHIQGGPYVPQLEPNNKVPVQCVLNNFF